MYDIITIGSSVIDTFIESKQFKLIGSNKGALLCQVFGDKVEIDNYTITTGGGGSNTAVGFARMGYKTGVVSELGTDLFSKVIKEDLQKEFVSCQFLVNEKKEKTGGSVILLSKGGGRTVLVHRGAASQLDPQDLPKNHLENAKFVHLSSIGGNQATLEAIFETLTPKKNSQQYKMSWNPGKGELELLKSGKIEAKHIPCEIFIVNKEEWQMIVDKQAEILQYFFQIIVTDGKNGGEVLVNGKKVLNFKSSDLTANKVIDETGAGDAFCVGYVTGFLCGLDYEKCTALGVKNAGSVVQYIGAKAGLLTEIYVPEN